MKANQVRTFILKNSNLVTLNSAADKLRAGTALSSADTGVVAIAANTLMNANLIDAQPWRTLWDGTNYVLFIFVTSA